MDGTYRDLAPLLERILEQVDCTDVTLTGGEPLLHPGLPALVSLLAGRGVRVSVITNGHRLDDLDPFLAANLEKVVRRRGGT